MSATLDDDDDEFGDFEEAAQVEVSQSEEKTQPEQEEPSTSFLESSAIEEELQQIESLESLLDADKLWIVEENAFDEYLSLQSDQNLLDLFSYFNTRRSHSLVPGDTAKLTLDLWTELRVIEETSALRFRWSSSQLYNNFAKALSFSNVQQQQQLPGKPNALHSPNGQSLANSFASENLDSLGDGSNSAAAAPEDFNWRGNTTVAAGSCNVNMNCEFFQSESPGGGPSILERDLVASGLRENNVSSAHTESNTTRILNGTTRNKSKSSPTSEPPRYLSVSDLNTEAKSFYERMPDLSFMLLDRVIRNHR